MATDCPPTADELREQLRAESQLAIIDWLEDLAVLYDTEAIPALRRRLGEQYRQSVGVLPEQRQEYAAGLARIVAGGRQ